MNDKQAKQVDESEISQKVFLELTVDVVSSYVSNNVIPYENLPSVIASVYESLNTLTSEQEVKPEEVLKPAVSIRRSISDDYITCLEDGKQFKSLKRHLRTHYDLSPEEYREKWGLPADYPMVAPSYATARSKLAKQMGLGQQRGRRAKA